MSLLSSASAVVTAALTLAPQAARAHDPYPVNWDATTGMLAGVLVPQSPPPGANTGCRPSAAHPYPVILVHGTFGNQDDNWQALAPLLANHGYCVFTFNYGGVSPSADIQGTEEITASAQQLADEVTQVRVATGASQVDLVGHSQGGVMPRYYLKFRGGAQFVHTLVGLAPTNHGTDGGGLLNLAHDFSLIGIVDNLINPLCVACTEQTSGSPFLNNLNAGGDTVPGVSYTVIASKDDEVVHPYTSSFLSGPGVTNITVQDQCALDLTEHLELAYDPVALADVLTGLDPAHPVAVPCVVVLPLTGPVGPVPPF